MNAIVAERGQVTIPKSLRDKLGIKPRTEVEFSACDGMLVATKAHIDRVSAVFGCPGRTIDSDRFVRGLRGEAGK